MDQENKIELMDWNENLSKSVTEFIDSILIRFSIQIFVEGGNDFKPYGSGVLLQTHGISFLLTASHVADYRRTTGKQLFVRVGSDKFINVAGDIKGTEIDRSNGVDIAYIKLAEEMIPYLEKSYKFLPINKISKHNPVLGGSNYCVVGFPEKNLRVIDGFSDTEPSFHLTMASNYNPYNFYKFSKEHFIIVEMKGKGTDLFTNEPAKIDSRFHGISGGGLWFLNYDLNPETNKYDVDYRLIGIMTEYRKDKYFCLIANKVHLYLDAFTKIEGLSFKPKT